MNSLEYKSGQCRDVLYNADCDPVEVCDAKSWSCKKEKEGNSEHRTNFLTNPTSNVLSFRKEMQRQYRLQTWWILWQQIGEMCFYYSSR